MFPSLGGVRRRDGNCFEGGSVGGSGKGRGIGDEGGGVVAAAVVAAAAVVMAAAAAAAATAAASTTAAAAEVEVAA